ncbi:hypothetical protein [Ruegeria sp. HKCCSP346]|uniref:hypothetical protein n=1 Tax=Ruegeria sp. HKCCSP346 TaxID=2794830 RepID=UPI001AE79844|nr:hypothetical protein [Ruegeria sp. HKCCSP346]
MADESWDIQSPPFGRYARFVAVTILLSLLFITFWPFFYVKSAAELLNLLAGFLWLYVFFLFWGSSFWVPVSLLALFPGIVVYRAVVSAAAGFGANTRIAVAAAALMTSLVSSLGVPIGSWLIGRECEMKRLMADLSDLSNYWPLIFGAPAALLSAFLILYKNEAT